MSMRLMVLLLLCFNGALAMALPAETPSEPLNIAAGYEWREEPQTLGANRVFETQVSRAKHLARLDPEFRGGFAYRRLAQTDNRLSCEQLGEIAQSTVEYRDQGQPLAAVLAEADRLEATGRFTRDDIALMRVVIRASFRRDKAPHEILFECKEQRR